MLDQFEAPLAVLTLDPDGAEVRRELKFEEGPLIDADLVGNTRIFHPRFAKNKPEWDANAVLPIGHGQKARGTLHYAKSRVRRADGKVDVDVTGKLEASGKVGQSEIKKGDYVVKGVQTYDPALGDWSSGKLTVDMDFGGRRGRRRAPSTARGPVVMTLTRRVALDSAQRPAQGVALRLCREEPRPSPLLERPPTRVHEVPTRSSTAIVIRLPRAAA